MIERGMKDHHDASAGAGARTFDLRASGGILAAVREGVVGGDALLGAARDLVKSDDGREALYDGAREQIFAALRSETLSREEVVALKELVDRLAALAWGSTESDEIDPLQRLAVRCEVLRDLSADTVAYQDAYDVESLRGQPHFVRCVAMLYDHGGAMSRSDLIAGLKLKGPNGTRVLKVLEKARLLTRKRGKSVEVALTLLGTKTAMAWRSPPSNPLPSVIRMGRLKGMEKDVFGISAPPRRKVG